MNSMTAMVPERPGMAPKMMPTAVPATISSRFSGWIIWEKMYGRYDSMSFPLPYSNSSPMGSSMSNSCTYMSQMTSVTPTANTMRTHSLVCALLCAAK